VAEVAVVLTAAIVLVCALFWRVASDIGSMLIGPTDSPATIGWLYTLQHEGGYHLFGTTHHTLTGAPFGWVGPNGLNIQWLLPYYPMYLLTKPFGPLTAYNLILLSGYVLSGAAMYLLVRYIGCNVLVAAWAGLVYIVAPWHLMRAIHPSLVHLEFLPLVLLAALAAARKPTWSRFGFVALATLACWLTSGYFGAMAVVSALAFAAGVWLSRAPHRLRIVGLTAGASVAATLIIGVLAHAADVGRTGGLDRSTRDLYSWGLHLSELVVPAAGNFVFGHWTRPFLFTRQHGSYPVETTNYLGILTITLAVSWLVLAWGRRNQLDARARLVTPGLTAAAIAAVVFGLPSPLTIVGTRIPMPSRLLWEIVPAFRTPSRWSIVVLTAIVPLGALALQAAATRASRIQWHRRSSALAPVAVVVAAMVISFLELGLNPNPASSTLSTKNVPAEYAALRNTRPGILAEYPLVPQLIYFFWQSVHHRPLLNTDAFGSPADDAQHALVNPSTPGTAEQLALLGVTSIVTHPSALRWSSAAYLPNPDSWGPGYRLVARSPDGSSTWSVVARPAPAFVSAVSGFTPPEALKDGTPSYALISPSGVGYLSIRAKQKSVVRLSFDADPPKGRRPLLRLADASNERRVELSAHTRVSLLVDVPRGFSLLLVKTDPAPTSRDDAIVLSRLRVEAAGGKPQLQAILEDADPGF
jgi:hypothetical protein